MDTQTLPTNQPQAVYVQMPQSMEQVIAFDQYLFENGWKRTDFGDYYNRDTKAYKTTTELYSIFRNSKIHVCG